MFLLNSLNPVTKIFVIQVNGFELAISRGRNQDTTVPARHMWKAGSLNSVFSGLLDSMNLLNFCSIQGKTPLSMKNVFIRALIRKILTELKFKKNSHRQPLELFIDQCWVWTFFTKRNRLSFHFPNLLFQIEHQTRHFFHLPSLYRIQLH